MSDSIGALPFGTMPAPSNDLIAGDDIWEALFSIMEGDVPEAMNEEVCSQLAAAFRHTPPPNELAASDADLLVAAIEGMCRGKIDHWYARSRGPIPTPDTALAFRVYNSLVDLKGRAIVAVRQVCAAELAKTGARAVLGESE